eukprot:5086195-Amphidinium_carterae.1
MSCEIVPLSSEVWHFLGIAPLALVDAWGFWSRPSCFAQTPSTPVAPQPWHSSHCPSAQSSNLQPKVLHLRAKNWKAKLSLS